MATKVTLRKRELPSGKITLYLDFYPPIRNPRTGELSRREYLGIYLEKNPRTSTAKTANAAKMRQAEAVRAQREISIINDSYDFIDRSRRKADFLAWFESVLKDKDQKWLRVYEHFKFFVHGNCKFEDVTIELCNGFKEYLTTADQLGHPGKKLAQNSAASYWSTFRALLAIAYKEKYLFENINDSLEKIPTIENRREFLTLDEVQASSTPLAKFRYSSRPVFSAASQAFASVTFLHSHGKIFRSIPTAVIASLCAPKRPKHSPTTQSANRPMKFLANLAPESSSKASNAQCFSAHCPTGSTMLVSPKTSVSTASATRLPPCWLAAVTLFTQSANS